MDKPLNGFEFLEQLRKKNGKRFQRSKDFSHFLDARAREKGVPINATIVAQTPLSGGERGQQIHLIIEFVEDGKKRKYYTQNYANDPDHVLKSTACMIYKYRNRYIENDFSYRENDNDPYVKITHMERKKKKNRKEMEEFVN